MSKKHNISERVEIKKPEKISIKYNGYWVTLKDILDELNDRKLLPSFMSLSPENNTTNEFSELFKITDGKYMTEEDMKKKAKEYEEMARYYEKGTTE